MPWNMSDYPVSMKNLDELIRKKAIDIANALLKDGYPDNRAIPIAISQAEKWFENADDKEKTDFRNEKNPQDDPHTVNKNAKKLLAADVSIKFENNQWLVITKGAKKPSDTFKTKAEAVARGKEIAQNKTSHLYIYKKDNTLQKKLNFTE